MTEQANTGWGLTVSRRFDTEAEAKSAVDSLRQAGFLEGEIRVWQQRKPAASDNEDMLARTIEGLMAGGVIGGIGAFFFSIAISWAGNDGANEEASTIAALIGAIIGAIGVAAAVNVISPRFSFSHPHEEHAAPGSVVTVMVGEKEAQAKKVFDSLG